MKDKDIIGKTFTAFKFDRTKGLRYSSQYKESFGKKAKVLYLHNRLPYAYCSIIIGPTTEIQNFYPIELIREQLEKKEQEEIDNIDLDAIFEQIKNLK